MAITISGLSANRTLLENTANLAAGSALDSNRSITLAGADFTDGGILSISNSGTALAEDQIFVNTSSITVDGVTGSFSISGGLLSFGGTLVGSVIGDGANGVGFAVSLEAGTSSLIVAALIERITYQNTSDNPTANRTFTTTIEDGAGNDFAQSTVVTVYSQNDAPTITAGATVALTETASTTASSTPLTSSGTLAFTDPDLTDVGHTASATVTASGTISGLGANASLLNYLTIGTVTKASGSTAGTIAWSFSAQDQAFDYLAAGETVTLTYTVTVNDGDGGTDGDTITVTVTGTNDTPTLVAVAGQSVTDTSADDTFVNLTGTLVGADVDASNVKTYAITGGSANSATINGVTYDQMITGTYGVLRVNSSTGAYVYVPNDTSIEALTANATDSFTFTVSDGTGSASQGFTVSLTGVNDAAVITGTATGSVTEAGGVSNGTAGTPTATGDLASTDRDGTADLFTAVASTASTGGYGTYAVTADGVWTYTLDDSNATVQALNSSQTLTDTFTVTAADGTTQTVTVTINGANDAAVITGTSTGSVTEASGISNGTAGTPTASADLGSTDVDNTADLFTAVASGAGTYGTYTVTTAGVWTYTLDDSNAAVQALNVGDSLSDTFTVTAADGTTQTVTITINGADDAAIITGTVTGSVTEAGGVSNGTAGTLTASADLTSTDLDSSGNNDLFTANSGSGTYGSYDVTAAGVWTYTIDDTNATVQALNSGQTLTDTFTVTTTDGTTQTVTVTINGANDDATITGTTTGSVTEAGGVSNGTAGTPTATGDLGSTDVDNTADLFTAVSSTTSNSGYGTYTVTTAGVWTYTLDNTNATVQALTSGGTLTDTITVTTTDGTTQTVTVTINGANDAAVITGTSTGSVTEAGGVSNGTAGTPTATGDLDSTDVDGNANTFNVVTSTASTNGYGTYICNSTGVWTYTLDNDNAAVQALTASGTLTDHITVTAEDGTTQTVAITIHGTNDAAVISGTTTGSVTESGVAVAGVPSDSGTLTSTDVDGTANLFTAVSSATASANGYGTYTVTAAGVWTYTLDNANAAVQALNATGASTTLTDTITVTTADGTTQTVTVTIHGRNDAAVITGTSTGSVTEAGGVSNGTAGTPTATGDLLSTDVDNTTDLFTVVASGTASTGGYGTYAVTAAGVWTYTLDDTNATVAALNASGTLTDTITVTTTDGTTQTVTVTINGANDAATITGTTTSSVTEAGGVSNGTAGTPTASADLGSTDVDNTTDLFTAVASGTASTSGYGTYAVTTAGVWTYTLDDTNATVAALNASGTLTDTITVTTTDGTTQTVTVTINGANDAATITGTTTGSVTEAGGVSNGTAGTPTASADLGSTDVDNTADLFIAVASGTASTGGYGTYAVTTAGVWTYTLDDTNATVQALNSGQTLTDTITVTTTDGTTQTVTVTINGANDTPTLAAVAGQSLTDTSADDTFGNLTGTLSATDVDSSLTYGISGTTSASGLGGYTLQQTGTYGVLHINTTTGAYVFVPNDAAIEGLRTSATDSFTFTVSDGSLSTSQDFTVTLNATSDTTSVTNDTGTVDEDSTLTTTAPGVLSNDTDRDLPSSLVVSGIRLGSTGSYTTVTSSGTVITTSYGTLTIYQDGHYTFATNSNADVLNTGGSTIITFEYQAQDSSESAVTASLVLTITGSNDASVITGTATGSVTEASGVSNAISGTPTATGDLLSTDVDNLENADLFTAASGSGTYGTYAVTTAGVWTYTLNNANATVQALNVGGTLTDTFTATAVDGTTQTVTITINGANDAAVISGTTTGSVTEASGVSNGTAGTPTATGDLGSTDVDNTADLFTAVSSGTASTGGYGTYAVTTAGVWTYTLDDTNATVQALASGQTLTDTITVTTTDGTTQTVTVTINGANDAAVITGTSTGALTEAGGVLNSTAGTPTATGDLGSTDVDGTADAFTPVSSTASTNGYGSYSLGANGIWTFVLDNNNSAVQALGSGGFLNDSFTVYATDGTSTTINVTITGTNDAAVITGTSTGSVTEAGGVSNGTAGTPTATGDLTSTDVDGVADLFIAGTDAATYGTYTVTSAGVWTYVVDDTNAAVQALSSGGTLSDTFTLMTFDGTTRTIMVTINGADDAAVISGTATGDVTESGGVSQGEIGTASATGILTSTDVDGTANLFTAVSSTTTSNGYGSYAVTAGGVWTYVLNNYDPAVDELQYGQTLTDSFIVTAADGTQQTVTITINGYGDAAVISGTSVASLTEAGGVSNGTVGTASASADLASTDVDGTDDLFLAVSSTVTTSGYGHYTVTAAGVWTYTLDNANATVEALGAGQTLTDSFLVTADDGTTQTVTVTINGVNDAAVISGTSTGSVTEASGVSNGTAGTPTATGELSATDVDGTADLFTATASTASTGGYGTYTVTSAGVWTYTLDDANATVQALNSGDSLTDSFIVTTVDGTQQTVTITIHGADDAGAITGDILGAVTEAGGVSNGTAGTPTVTGDLTSTDVDNPGSNSAFVAAATDSDNGYGTYAVDTAGTWSYTLDNTNAAVQGLSAGEILTDTFTVTAEDGVTQTVTLTITGANDTPTITEGASLAFTEAGDSTGGTTLLTESGTLVFTDVDLTDIGHTASVTGVSGAGTVSGLPSDATLEEYLTIGSVTKETGATSGTIEYTFSAEDQAFDYLATGESVTLTYTVALEDGSGGTDTETVIVTITGANDTPVVTVSEPDAVLDTAGATLVTIADQVAISDADTSDTQSSYVSGTLAYVSGADQYAFDLDTAGGVIAYDPGDFASLAAGETTTAVFSFNVQSGADVVTREITLTINGANEAPALTVAALGTLTDTAGDDTFADLSGTISATDIDTNDTLTYAISDGTASDAQEGYDQTRTGTYGDLYINSATGAYLYVADNAAVQGLSTTATDVFTLTVSDGTSEDSQSFSVTLNGVNDAPTGVNDSYALTENEGASLDVLANDADSELADTATLVSIDALQSSDVTGLGTLTTEQLTTLTALFSIDAETGTITFAPGAGLPGEESLFDQLNVGQSATIALTYGFEDAGGLSSSATATITVAGEREPYSATDLGGSLSGSAYDDDMQGSGVDDDLFGLAGRDSLTGGAGSDRLIGGEGIDTLVGGLGNDIYSVDSASDVVVEAEGQGTDTVVTTVTYALDAGQAVERLQLSSSTGTTALNLTGNEFANRLVGNGGDNTLNGLGGADDMRGGGGNDVYGVDDASDLVMEGVGGGTDTIVSTIGFALAAGQEVEKLQFSSATGATALNLTGNELANTLIGNRGANTLSGLAGVDNLRGGAGADILIGGQGADVFVFTSAADSTPAVQDIVRAGGSAVAFENPGSGSGDIFDLQGIDANTSSLGDQAFVFGTTTGIGHLWLTTSGTHTIVNGNTNADAAIEFQLVIEDGAVSASSYTAGDFLL